VIETSPARPLRERAVEARTRLQSTRERKSSEAAAVSSLAGPRRSPKMRSWKHRHGQPGQRDQQSAWL